MGQSHSFLNRFAACLLLLFLIPEPRRADEELLRKRCTACHAIDYLDGKHWTRLDWELTILRMRTINGAELQPGDRGRIIAHLLQRQPPGWDAYLFDAMWITLILGPLAYWLWRRRRK